MKKGKLKLQPKGEDSTTEILSALNSPRWNQRYDLQKYKELHKRSRMILEKMHSRPGISQSQLRLSGQFLKQSKGNTLLKPTVMQLLKKRRKAGPTDVFFEREMESGVLSSNPNNRIMVLRKIYRLGPLSSGHSPEPEQVRTKDQIRKPRGLSNDLKQKRTVKYGKPRNTARQTLKSTEEFKSILNPSQLATQTISYTGINSQLNSPRELSPSDLILPSNLLGTISDIEGFPEQGAERITHIPQIEIVRVKKIKKKAPTTRNIQKRWSTGKSRPPPQQYFLKKVNIIKNNELRKCASLDSFLSIYLPKQQSAQNKFREKEVLPPHKESEDNKSHYYLKEPNIRERTDSLNDKFESKTSELPYTKTIDTTHLYNDTQDNYKFPVGKKAKSSNEKSHKTRDISRIVIKKKLKRNKEVKKESKKTLKTIGIKSLRNLMLQPSLTSQRLQETLANTILYQESITIKINCEFYNRIKAREILKQIKFHFRYEPYQSFPSIVLVDYLKNAEKIVERNAFYSPENIDSGSSNKIDSDKTNIIYHSPYLNKEMSLPLFLCYMQERNDSFLKIEQMRRLDINVGMADLFNLGDSDLMYMEGIELSKSFEENQKKKMKSNILEAFYSCSGKKQDFSFPSDLKIAERFFSYQRYKYSYNKIIKKMFEKPKIANKRRPSNGTFVEPIIKTIKYNNIHIFACLSDNEDSIPETSLSEQLSKREIEKIAKEMLLKLRKDPLDLHKRKGLFSGTPFHKKINCSLVTPINKKEQLDSIKAAQLDFFCYGEDLSYPVTPHRRFSHSTTLSRDSQKLTLLMLEPLHIYEEMIKYGRNNNLSVPELIFNLSSNNLIGLSVSDSIVGPEFRKETIKNWCSYELFIRGIEYNELFGQVTTYWKPLQEAMAVLSQVSKKENKSFIIMSERIAAPFIFQTSSLKKKNFSDNWLPRNKEDSFIDSPSSDDSLVMYVPLKRDTEIIKKSELNRNKKKKIIITEDVNPCPFSLYDETDLELFKEIVFYLRQSHRVLNRHIMKDLDLPGDLTSLDESLIDSNLHNELLELNENSLYFGEENKEGDFSGSPNLLQLQDISHQLDILPPQYKSPNLIQSDWKKSIIPPASSPRHQDLESLQSISKYDLISPRLKQSQKSSLHPSVLIKQIEQYKEKHLERKRKAPSRSPRLERMKTEPKLEHSDIPEQIPQRKISKMQTKIISMTSTELQIPRRRYKQAQPGISEGIQRNSVQMLFEAIRRLQVNEVETILSTYPSVKLESLDHEGTSMLHVAVCLGSRSIVELLIRAGADINIQDKSGNTPAHYARSLSHYDILDLLLVSGAIEGLRNNADQAVWESDPRPLS